MALHFDGSSVVTVASDVFRVASSTWMAWVRRTNTTDLCFMGYVYSTSSRFCLRAFGTDQFRYYDDILNEDQLGTLSACGFTAGIWHHIATVFNSDGTKDFYVDGVAATPSDSDGANLASIPSGAKWTLGSYSTTVGQFVGDIAEASSWDKTLSQAEIQTFMYKKLNGGEPNLLVYLPMDDAGIGTNIPIKNFSNSPDGAMVGFTGNPWVGGPPVFKEIAA